jgi:predicted ATPase/class 3 adenylate cyclase
MNNHNAVHCPACESENPPGARFCLSCGERLAAACWDCGGAVPAGARFCIHCGARQEAGDRGQEKGDVSEALTATLQQIARLQAAAGPRQSGGPRPNGEPAAHERRLVTLLFVDVQSYSTIASQLDPEDVVELMNGAYTCMIEPVYRYQGSIIHNLGDAILACFGAGVAREDDPERAVRAGLDITAAIRQYAGRLAAERGLKAFDVRVGINTGLVVIGEMGSDQWTEFTALGDAVNLAARMQQNAPPGGVLISSDTYRHVRGLFDLAPQEPMVVKGRQEPVQTYLVQGAKPRAWRVEQRGVEGVETRMVGRDLELSRLQEAYRQAARGGEARLVLVTGEPGIGKSRLLDEFDLWTETQPESIAYFKGRASQATQGVPYSVFRDLFANRCTILESDSPVQAMEKFRRNMQDCLDADSADQVGQLVGFDFSASLAVRPLMASPSFALLASAYLVHYFRRLASQPALILLEDLHWADDASLDLLLRLVEDLQKSRLLVIGAARRQLLERKPELVSESGGPVLLEVQPLASHSCQELVGEILKQVEAPPAALRQQIVQRMEGNPYFAEELVQVLIDDEVIERREPRWQVQMERLSEARIPSTLTGILQARLDCLDASEKLLLQRASVTGRIFWRDLLEDLAGSAEEKKQVRPTLEALRRRGLIYQRQPSIFAGSEEYAFNQNMLREVTYEMVLLRQRRGYHARTALWLEKQAGKRLDEYLGLIAHHSELAGAKESAAGWYLRAGERARQQGALHEARHFLDHCLGLLPEGELERRWQALAERDSILGSLGEIEARNQDSQAMLALARQVGDERKLAEAWYHAASAAEAQGLPRQALEGFNAALALAEKVGDEKLVAEVLPMKLLCLARLSETQEAAGIAEEALVRAEALGDPLVLVKALNNLSVYYDAVGDLSRAAELLSQMVAVCGEMKDRMGEVMGLSNLGYDYLQLGLFAMGLNSLRQALDLSEAVGARRLSAYARLNLALIYWRIGDLANANQQLAEATGELQRIGDAFGTASAQAYQGLAFEAGNDLAGADSCYLSACEQFERLGMPGLAADSAAGLARVAHGKGEMEQAAACAGQAWIYLDNRGGESMEFPLLAYQTLAETFETLGRTDEARRVLECGHTELMARASKISNPAWRRSFMENIQEHRRVEELWQRTFLTDAWEDKKC